MTAARLHWILTAIERNLLTEEELALLKALENPEDLTQNQPIKSCGDGRLEWLFRDCLLRYFEKREPKFAPTPELKFLEVIAHDTRGRNKRLL